MKKYFCDMCKVEVEEEKLNKVEIKKYDSIISDTYYLCDVCLLEINKLINITSNNFKTENKRYERDMFNNQKWNEIC